MSLCSAPSEPLCVFLTLPVYFSLSLAVSPLTLVSLSPTNFLLVSVPESLWVDDCLSLCLILSSLSLIPNTLLLGHLLLSHNRWRLIFQKLYSYLSFNLNNFYWPVFKSVITCIIFFNESVKITVVFIFIVAI